jgi:uncharacterized protein
MRLRFFAFLLILSLVLLCSGLYVGLRVTSVWSDSNHTLVWAGISIVVLLQLAGPFIYRALPFQERRFFALRWVVFTFMGIGVTLTLYTLIADLLILCIGVVSRHTAAAVEPYGIGLALALVVVSNLAGVFQMALGPFVKKIEIPLPDEFAALSGTKIAQISDLHVGPSISRAFASKVVNICNSLSPDIVALTGDLIDGFPDVIRESCAPLAGLKSRYGCYGVFGNHEFYWNPLGWDQVYRDYGINTLHSDCRRVEIGGTGLAIMGIPDMQSFKVAPGFPYDLALACSKSRPGDFRLLLAHQPKSALGIEDQNINLVLSGHTHGGQFFPFTLLVRLAEPFVAGLYRVGESWLYVNRGTGYWGPPTRFLVPPEITLITLVSAASKKTSK